jgi:tetratricopeptide (TPR) repeat protein
MASEEWMMPDADILRGKQVAVTGRLASMTRAEIAELIRAHGGSLVGKVSPRTSVLILGQDGWPLEQDGTLANDLRKCRVLQRSGHEILVLSEEELLARLGREQQAVAVQQVYNTVQLSRLLKIPGNRLRGWVREGLIRPVQTASGINYFDYSQVVSAKTLWDLIKRGAKPARLRRSIRQLKSWLTSVEQPLHQLAILECNGELMVRLEDGLAEPSGQRFLDFDGAVDRSTVALSAMPTTADQWFQKACKHEECEEWHDAVEAYRQALLADGPQPIFCFNLANALCRLGNKAEAAERYHQAVEIDRNFAEAWNNLGVTLADLGRTEQALAAFAQALRSNPDYVDAHYNLADLLDETGQGSMAFAHWQAYLSRDAQSPWAKYARQRLAATSH